MPKNVSEMFFVIWFGSFYLKKFFCLVLEEQNEELHAMVLNKGVEEGRHLLNGTSNSLAFELGEMNNREVKNYVHFSH